MTEDLRARLRADLSAEQPPPLGDVVGAAIRDGRRLRRKRRWGTAGAWLAAAAGALAVAVVLVGERGVAVRPGPVIPAAGPPSVLPPGSVPSMTAVPPAASPARTLTVHSGTVRAVGTQTKATSAAMLHLLTLLLPPGRTSHYGVAPDDDLRVQLYLDDGGGPAMVRVAVSKADTKARSGAEAPRGATTTVTIQYMPDNCLQGTTVDARWPDGTLVEVAVPTCLAADSPPTRPALTTQQAIRVASDPRWGVTMDPRLVERGARQFPVAVPGVAR